MKKVFLSLAKNPFFQGSVILSVGSVLGNFFTYLFNTILARFVSVADYGEYLTAVSYLMVMMVALSILNLLIIQRVAGRLRTDRASYSSLLISKIFHLLRNLSGVMIITFLIVGAVIYFIGSLTAASVMFVLAMFVIYFFAIIFSAIYQAQKLFLLATTIMLGVGLAKFSAIVVLLINPNLPYVYVFIVLAELVVLWWAWQRTKTRHTSSLITTVNISKSQSRQLIAKIIFERKTVLSLLTLVGLLMMINIDVMIAKRIFAPETAGFYAALNLLVKIIFYVASPLTSVAFSYFSDNETELQHRRILALGIAGVGLIGIAAVGGYSMLAPLVVSVVFGQAYQPIVIYLTNTALFGGVYILANLLGHYWLAKGSPLATASLLVVIGQGLVLSWLPVTLGKMMTINVLAAVVLTGIYSLGFMFRITQLPSIKFSH